MIPLFVFLRQCPFADSSAFDDVSVVITLSKIDCRAHDDPTRAVATFLQRTFDMTRLQLFEGVFGLIESGSNDSALSVSV